MAVGDFVYVGKSRVRRFRKEKRRKRKEEKLTRASPAGGGSPGSGRVLYTALTSHHDDGDDVSLGGYDVMRDIDADSCSIGSSGSEDLLPLLDFDLALDLRPQTDKYIPRAKMPFELFKKKEKKKAVEEKKEEPKTNTDNVKKDTNNDVKTDVPEKAEVKDAVTAPPADQKVAAQVAADSPVAAPGGQEATTETETVDGAETMNDETVRHDTTEETQLLQESPKPDQQAVKEVPEEEKKEEKKEEKEPEKEKEEVKVKEEEVVQTETKVEPVHANGTMASMRQEPLRLEKVNAEDDDRMGVMCCNIL